MHVKKKDLNSADKNCSKCSSEIHETYVEVSNVCFCGKCFRKTMAEYFFSEDKDGLLRKKNKLTDIRTSLMSLINADGISASARIITIENMIDEELVEIRSNFNNNVLSVIEEFLK